MKKLAILLVLSFLFITSSSQAFASLLTIGSRGEVIWKVLSSEDSSALGVSEKSDIEVKEVAGSGGQDQSLLLKKENEKIVLNVGDTKQLDVTNWDSDLIEIEERGDVKKITVLIQDGKFVISQGDIFAKTDFPVRISPKENELSLVTSSGSTALVVLPLEASQTALRSKFISLLDKNLEIQEKDLGVLAYSIQGEKVIDIFNVLKFNIPVTTFVSTTTGEILSVDQPKWLSILGFLFT